MSVCIFLKLNVTALERERQRGSEGETESERQRERNGRGGGEEGGQREGGRERTKGWGTARERGGGDGEKGFINELFRKLLKERIKSS